VSAAWIIAVAHPTPLSTRIAPGAQLTMQAPHSMQSAGAANSARRPFMRKTACGHTSTQRPHPLHAAGS
jgi:hypothetical protein